MRRIRFLFAWLVLFVFALVWNACVHLVVLKEANASVQHLHRPDFADKMWLSLLLTAGVVLLFLWGYGRIARTGSIWEGVCFGIYVGLLAGLLVDANQYLLYPIPASLAAKWFVGGLIEFTLYGALVTKLHPVGADRRHRLPEGERIVDAHQQ